MGRDLPFKAAAISMEAELREFYLKMVDTVASERSKEILSYLAEQELTHARKIEEMAAVVVNTEDLDRAFTSAGVIMDFLRGDLGRLLALSSEMEDEEDLLNIAIQCEKDMFLFYDELEKQVSDSDLAEQVKMLAGYEKEHMKELVTLLNLVKRETP
ncbi:MAG: ferritin-like domain-containing protein [Planctomycetota bacterium]|jgi:rubrerythrin